MIHSKRICSMLAAAVLMAACAAGPSGQDVVALTGAMLIDGTGAAPVPNSTILVSGGRITASGPASSISIPSAARVINVNGKTIIPGIISNHSHVGIVQGTQSRPENYSREFILSQLRQYEALGVTTVTSLGMNGPLFYEIRNEMHAGTTQGADLFGADRGIGVEKGAPPATIVSIAADQIYRPNTPAEARKAVSEMAERRTDFVKVWLDDFGKSQPAKVAPEVYAALVDEAHKRNLRVAAHIHDLDDGKNILKVGGDIVAHGIRDKVVDEEFIKLMKDRSAWYIATLVLDHSNFDFAERGDALLNDPMLSPWIHPQIRALISDPAWRARVSASPGAANARKDLAMNKVNLMTLYKAGIPIGFGSDSGVGLRIPGIAEHRELMLMVEAGFTPMQALTIATSNAARLMRLNDRGVIKSGMLADLVVLNADPLQDISNTMKIDTVWHRGKPVPKN